jgi:hypothetical protein
MDKDAQAIIAYGVVAFLFFAGLALVIYILNKVNNGE